MSEPAPPPKKRRLVPLPAADRRQLVVRIVITVLLLPFGLLVVAMVVGIFAALWRG